MQENDRVYVTANVVPDLPIFLAVENVDVAEDKPLGKHTLRGSVMTIYLWHNSEDITQKLELRGQLKMNTTK